ncbi:hypothetical protein, partial [Burkholderia sp. Tr-20355]|uniref:hypothetical protein n=1 Tax=Burkholderia sp. Tr-20355 TaxID=2703895 RepID=UPI00197EB5E9
MPAISTVAFASPQRCSATASRQEERHGKRQVAEDRHRLQHVEQRDQHALGAAAARRGGRIDE